MRTTMLALALLVSGCAAVPFDPTDRQHPIVVTIEDDLANVLAGDRWNDTGTYYGPTQTYIEAVREACRWWREQAGANIHAVGDIEPQVDQQLLHIRMGGSGNDTVDGPNAMYWMHMRQIRLNPMRMPPVEDMIQRNLDVTLAHEIGHSMGMKHDIPHVAVMSAGDTDPNLVFKLTEHDLEQYRSLWGAR